MAEDNLRQRIIEAIRPQIERGNDVREWPDDEKALHRDYSAWDSFTDRHEKVVELRLQKAADAVLAEIKRDMIESTVAERWEVAYQYDGLDDAESAYAGTSPAFDRAVSMELRPVLDEPTHGPDWTPPPGWRELGEGEAAGGREFLVHGWLRRPIDSFHQQRGWVRDDIEHLLDDGEVG
jgi:hypothetical protein